LPAVQLRSFCNSPRLPSTTDCQLTKPTVSVSTLGSGKTRGVGWQTLTGLRVPADVCSRVCRNVGSYEEDCLRYQSKCSLVQKDQLFTALAWIVGSSKTSVRPNQTARRHGRFPSPPRNGRSVLTISSNSDSRADCHLACFFRTNAPLADMLSDGRGAERGDPLAAVRDVTGRGISHNSECFICSTKRRS